MLLNKIKYSALPAILLIVCGLAACTNQGGEENPSPHTNSASGIAAPDKACGKPFLFEMISQGGTSKGYGEIWNDSSHVHVSFAPGSGQGFASATVKYILPKGKSIAFPPMKPAGEGFMYSSLPLGETAECGKVQFAVQVSNVSDGSTQEAKPTPGGPIDAEGLVRYCVQQCTETACEDPKPTTTHTTHAAAQWLQEGSAANLYAKSLLERADAQGIQLGCQHPKLIRSIVELAAWVKEGQIGAKGGLGKEVAALALNLYCDHHDPAFSKSDFPLANLVVASGSFQGWRTADLLTEAEAVLGGCPSNYSVDQMTTVLEAINGWCKPNSALVLTCP